MLNDFNTRIGQTCVQIHQINPDGPARPTRVSTTHPNQESRVFRSHP
jgi:hypothetical protein